MYYQFFFAKKVHLLPPNHASRCFSNEFSQHYWQESFDGDSFASQSRFDAYAIGRNPSMVIPLLANQDLTPMLGYMQLQRNWRFDKSREAHIFRGSFASLDMFHNSWKSIRCIRDKCIC